MEILNLRQQADNTVPGWVREQFEHNGKRMMKNVGLRIGVNRELND